MKGPRRGRPKSKHNLRRLVLAVQRSAKTNGNGDEEEVAWIGGSGRFESRARRSSCRDDGDQVEVKYFDDDDEGVVMHYDDAPSCCPSSRSDDDHEWADQSRGKGVAKVGRNRCHARSLPTVPKRVPTCWSDDEWVCPPYDSTETDHRSCGWLEKGV